MRGSCLIIEPFRREEYPEEKARLASPEKAVEEGESLGWAEEEFGAASLGDARRTQRLIHLAQMLGQRPDASLPEATNGWGELKGAYRFFANEAIEPAAILKSHVEATYRRMEAVEVVLAVQDTTLLNFTAHPATQDLGPLASRHQKGLIVHSTLALTPERVPLGLVAQEVWARDEATYGSSDRQKGDHKKRTIEEKESRKWLHSVEAVVEARKHCPRTHFISVGDREADVYDLFLQPRPEDVDLLVRAAWDRKVDHEEKYLWTAMTTAPVAATLTLEIPKRGNQPARQAEMTVRWKAITLRPPNKREKEHLPPVKVYAVWAIETLPPGGLPEGASRVEWMLLTTVPVITTEQALEKLEWYSCRWGIEVWHKVLKSGCRIEEKQLEKADRLKRCLSVYSVVAWRILWATMLARKVPEVACTVLLEEEEWQALYCAIHRVALLPPQPPSLREAVRWIAQLGGFLGRKRDCEPGITVLWKGFQHLADLTLMYRILRRAPAC